MSPARPSANGSIKVKALELWKEPENFNVLINDDVPNLRGEFDEKIML